MDDNQADESRPCYMARCPGCNHVIALTLDAPEYRKDVARDVAEWIADGLIVERSTAAVGRKLFDLCVCPRQSLQDRPETLPLFEQETTQ